MNVLKYVLKLAVWVTAAFTALTIIAPASFAQLAMKPLLPQGLLELPVGSASPMKESARAYGELELITGEQEFTDGQVFDVERFSISGAADILAGPAIFSFGYVTQTTTFESVFSGLAVEQEDDTTGLAVRLSMTLGASGTVALEAVQVDESTTVTFSGPGVSASGSADTGFTNVTIGGSADVTESIRAGASYSPEVSDRGEFGGQLVGTSTDGHGNQFQAAVGYNTAELALGFDFFMEDEQIDSFSNSERAFIFTGEILFGDTSLTGQYVFIQDDELIDNGNFISPESESALASATLRVRFDQLVLGFEISRFEEEASAFGVAAEDADRFDSQSQTLVAVSLVGEF